MGIAAARRYGMVATFSNRIAKEATINCNKTEKQLVNNMIISKQYGPLNERTVTQFCDEKKAFHWIKGFSKIVQLEIRRGRLTEAPKTQLYRVSLDLRNPIYNCVCI